MIAQEDCEVSEKKAYVMLFMYFSFDWPARCISNEANQKGEVQGCTPSHLRLFCAALAYLLSKYSPEPRKQRMFLTR